MVQVQPFISNPNLFGGVAGCSRGGVTAAAKMTTAQREQRSSNAGNATVRKYGVDYYAALGRKSWRKKQSS